MFRVKLTGRARKELEDISKRHQQALSEIFDELKDDPYLGKALTRELTGSFSYRMGVFRIIYKVNEKNKEILILTAGHRSIVYN
jgi:mRNA interferase RelE/StbE